MIRIILTAALVIAVTAFGPRPARAYEAPWCAVISLGTGSVYWDCQYRTVEECVPNVLAGNRGWCNPNPYYYGLEQPRRKHPARRRHRV